MSVNVRKYIEEFLKIKSKSAEIIELKLTPAQDKLYRAIVEKYKAGVPIRIIILKARQLGFSTLVEAIIFVLCVTNHNISSAVVTHEKPATDNLFRIFKRYLENLPEILKPEITSSNSKELIFNNSKGTGLGSSIKCFTAGNMTIGRSDTFQYLHISEYAFWPGKKGDTFTGLMQSVPPLPDSIVVIESTANGMEDFKDLWDAAVAGESDYIPIFCAWWEQQEYRMEYTGFELEEEEKELIKLYNLDLQQISWRRWCIKNNCRGDKNLFKQEYPSCPDEAFLMSGRPVFNLEIVSNRIAALEKQYKEEPYKEGYFEYEWKDPESRDQILPESIRFVESSTQNLIRMYQKPKHDNPYVIGGDTKGEGSDFFTGTVIDNITGERVATLRMDIMESNPYTYQMYCMGLYYNTALIGIEINFNQGPVEELARLKYSKQYNRRTYDDYTKQVQKKYGWKTDGNTRPLIIDKEADLVQNNINLFQDVPTLREMLTFTYDKNGRPDAISGKHDDLLFSDMIANEIRQQQTFSVKLPERDKRKYSKDMMEDWRRATNSERKMMIEMWGYPR